MHACNEYHIPKYVWRVLPLGYFLYDPKKSNNNNKKPTKASKLKCLKFKQDFNKIKMI